MKKRILAFLLTAIMLLQMFVGFPVIAEDGIISIDDMEVGVLYKATFSHDDVLLRNATGNLYMAYGYETSVYVDEEHLPTDLLVMVEWEGSDLICIKNEDWPEKFAYYRYVYEDELIIFGKAETEPEPPVVDDGYIHGKVDVVCGDAVDGIVTVEEGEKTYAFTNLDEEISDGATYMWQIKLDDGRWANITDYRSPYAVLSKALLVNEPTSTGKATIRCIVTDGEKQYASSEIGLVEKPAESQAMMFMSRARTVEEDVNLSSDYDISPVEEYEGAFQINISYFFAPKDDFSTLENAQTPFVVSLAGNETFTSDVNSPFVIGYTACVMLNGPDENDKTIIEYAGKYYRPQPSWHFEKVGIADIDKQKVEIYYVPQKTNFIVEHYYQNLKDDGYSLVGMDVIKTKYTDEEVGDKLERTEYGYTALFYDTTTKVSGNGNTIIEIYYDRIYYLVNFDLGDGGYGLMPYYVRFGTQIMLTAPTRPGYSFVNPWTLTRVYTKDDDSKVETEVDMTTDILSAYSNKNANATITVKHNLKYTANWKAESTSYTIAYWLEDPNYKDGVDPESEKYKIWGTRTITGAKSGDIVDGPGAKDVPSDWVEFTGLVKDDGNKTKAINLLNYLDFIKSDQDVEVHGDGSTVVNVYYDRKEYTLKFYYARSKGSGANTVWYVAGQTNSFAETSDNQELDCLENNSGQFGQVDSEPTIKDGVVEAKGYTFGKEDHVEGTTTYTYHYLSFKAKYGADISKQYPCDIFNSVERTSNSYSNGWSDKTVLMSAWSGEYNVLFSRVGGNQTMKGKFQILDYRMLWDPSASGWNTKYNDNTISYLAFWENAINVSWNIPELYRYKIWLQVLDEQVLPENTTYYTDSKGIRYYLSDVYDTCDNSQVSEQTQPTLVGFNRYDSFSRGNIGSSTYNNWSNTPDLTKAEVDEIRELMVGTYNEAWIVNYLYTRNTAQLSFSNMYDYNDSHNVSYEESLEKYKTTVPEYPAGVESGALVFEGDLDGDGIGDGGGWYIDESLTIEFSFDEKMGTDNIQLFAKWLPTEHKVQVYRQESEIDSTEAGELLLDVVVEFGTQIQESALAAYVKPNENYVFGGWFYEDENGNKNRYDFNTMVIKHSYVIYAEWIKNVPIPYTVKYVTMVGDEKIEIATPDSGVALESVQKTFRAKTGSDLLDGYTEWYFPEERYITLEMSANAEDNVVEFVYETAESVTYYIKHVFKSTSFANYIPAVNLFAANTSTNTSFNAFFDGVDTLTLEFPYTITKGTNDFTATVTSKFSDRITQDTIKAVAEKLGVTDNKKKNEVWNIVKSLTPDNFTQELYLTLDNSTESSSSNNVITFEWEYTGTTTMYQVVYYIQNKGTVGKENDKNSYSVYLTEGYIVNKEVGKEYSAEWMEIYGYETYAEISTVSGKLPDSNTTGVSGLVLELYYTRTKYTYTVHHYVIGSTTELHKDEKYDGSKDYPQAVYGEEITVKSKAKEINGYVLYNGDTIHTIGADNYEIVVYYSPIQVVFRYQEAIAGRGNLSKKEDYIGYVGSIPDPEKSACTATAYEGYRFIGWFLDVEGTIPVSSKAILSDDGATVTPKTPTPEMANQTVVFYAVFEPTTRVFKNSGVIDEDQVFIYRLQGNTVDVTFVIVGNDYVSLSMVPTGNYTVTVLDWAWRYGAPKIRFDDTNYTLDENGSCTFVIDGTDDVEFKYSEVRYETQWLTDEAYYG